MALPNSRKQLKDYCLRRLGHPVTQINVDPDQIEDRIDEALLYFQQYHSDSMLKFYLQHRVTQQDKDQQFIDCTIASGDVSVLSGANTIFGDNTNFVRDFAPGKTTVIINGENKTILSVANAKYMFADSNFTNTANNIPMKVTSNADSIVGVVKIFPIASTSVSVNMFDLRYQLRLHELYDFTSTSYINYVMTQQHLRSLEMLFSGEISFRYNRHQNRLFVDFSWANDIATGEWIVAECWRIVDPEQYPAIYGDMYLLKYATALIKRQWGANLSKYKEVVLPGGVTLNGGEIYAKADAEVLKLEDDIQLAYEEPPSWYVG